MQNISKTDLRLRPQLLQCDKYLIIKSRIKSSSTPYHVGINWLYPPNLVNTSDKSQARSMISSYRFYENNSYLDFLQPNIKTIMWLMCHSVARKLR